MLQSEFSSLVVKKVALDIDSCDEKKQFQIDQVIVSPHEVRAGEKVQLTAILVGDNGAEVSRTVSYTVPIGAPAGPLYFTVADGNVANLSEFRQILGSTPRSVEQLVASVNKLRANTKAYVRVWRAEPNFQLDAEDFHDPPPSLALILCWLAKASLCKIEHLTDLPIEPFGLGGHLAPLLRGLFQHSLGLGVLGSFCQSLTLGGFG